MLVSRNIYFDEREKLKEEYIKWCRDNSTTYYEVEEKSIINVINWLLNVKLKDEKYLEKFIKILREGEIEYEKRR